MFQIKLQQNVKITKLLGFFDYSKIFGIRFPRLLRWPTTQTPKINSKKISIIKILNKPPLDLELLLKQIGNLKRISKRNLLQENEFYFQINLVLFSFYFSQLYLLLIIFHFLLTELS